MLLVLAATRFAAAFVRRYWAGRVSLDVQNDLRTEVYDHLQRLDVARHDEMSTGQLVSRAISDIGLIQGLLAFLPMVLANVLFLAVALVAMIWLSPLLTVVSLVITPLLVVVSMRLRTSVFPASWDAQQQAGAVAGVVDESVSGVRVVKGFGQEEREVTRLADTAERLYASRVRAIRLQARYQPLLQTMPALGPGRGAGPRRLAGDRGHHHPRHVPGVLDLRDPAPGARPDARRAGHHRPAGTSRGRAGVRPARRHATWCPTPMRPLLEVTEGRVEFHDVAFGYPRGEPVLADLTWWSSPARRWRWWARRDPASPPSPCSCPASTTCRPGTIRVDGTDVSTVTSTRCVGRSAWCSRTPSCSRTRSRNNIAYGRPDATAEEIEAAARVAEADAFIAALADGYDTVVGERGLTLSGGQRQRIALARALLTEPAILVLDDATSAVDSRIEPEIHETLRQVAGRAHHPPRRPSAVDPPAGRPHRGARRRPRRRRRHPRRAPGPLPRCTVCCSPAPATSWSRTPTSWPSPPVEADHGRRHHARAVGPHRRRGRRGRPGPGGRGQARCRRPRRGHGRPGPARAAWACSAACPATPELLAQVDALPPAADRPDQTVRRGPGRGPHFRFTRFIRPWRKQLAVGFGLVVARRPGHARRAAADPPRHRRRDRRTRR